MINLTLSGETEQLCKTLREAGSFANNVQLIDFALRLYAACQAEADCGYKICAVDDEGDVLRELVLNEPESVSGIDSTKSRAGAG